MTVTQFVKAVEQPKQGILPLEIFLKKTFTSLDSLYDQSLENIAPNIIGLVVDYMSRLILSFEFIDTTQFTKENAFQFSLWGANNIGKLDRAKELLNDIDGLNDKSIINAIKLVGYDACYRRGLKYHNESKRIPNKETLHNIKELINRTVVFFRNNNFYDCTLFFDSAYNDVITNGDADLMSKTTIWDIKVSKSEPTKDDTLQILIYYLLAKKTKTKELIEFYKDLNSIGIFNPRLNTSWYFDTNALTNKGIEVLYKMMGF